MLRWLVTCAAAGAAMTPLIWLGWQQRQAIAWMTPPTGHDIWVLVVSLTAGTTASALVFAVLIVVGAVRADWPRAGWPRVGWPRGGWPVASRLPAVAPRGAPAGPPPAVVPLAAWAGRPERTLSWIAVPWLLLPPAALLIAAEFKPVYEFMYVEYCLPAVALLVGAGIAALGWPLRFAALGLVAALGLPAQVALRQPQAGGFIRSTAQFLAAHEKPGDAVYYPGPGGVPAWDITYPRGFAGLRGIQLDQPAAQAGLLAGTSEPRVRHRTAAGERAPALDRGGDQGVAEPAVAARSRFPAGAQLAAEPDARAALRTLVTRTLTPGRWRAGEAAGMRDAEIGLLHPGEMGAAVGGCLAGLGRTVRWASAGRGPATAARARHAGLADAGTAAELARRSDIILSVCPPHAAVAVARSVAAPAPAAAGVRPAPGAAATGTAAGSAACTSTRTRSRRPPPVPSPRSWRRPEPVTWTGESSARRPAEPGGTRLYLSGPRAAEIVELFAGTRVEARIVGGRVGAASAVKMAYAAWTKGTAALYWPRGRWPAPRGCRTPCWPSGHCPSPTWPAGTRDAARSAAVKGWRWVAEMEEIADSMAAAGLPPGFHQSAAEVFRRQPQAASADAASVEAVICRPAPAGIMMPAG